MVILALDTSQAVGSAALAVRGEMVGVERFDQPSSHLVALGRAVERLLAAGALAARDIDRVAVVIGPGSFTGLRIGLAFTKGLHAARAVEVVTIDSLRLLALPHLETAGHVCAMIDARRAEVYAAAYACATETESAREVASPRAESPEAFLASLDAAPWVCVGTGAIAHAALIGRRFPGAQIVGEEGAYPSTSHLAAIAGGLRALDAASVRALEPLYLRPSGAERMRLRPVGDDPQTPAA